MVGHSIIPVTCWKEVQTFILLQVLSKYEQSRKEVKIINPSKTEVKESNYIFSKHAGLYSFELVCGMCHAENWLNLLLNPVVLDVCIAVQCAGQMGGEPAIVNVTVFCSTCVPSTTHLI